MKYVMFDYEIPVIFPTYIGHNELKISSKIPTSAGFIAIGTDKCGVTCECYGKSISLRLQSREIDSKICQKILNPHR